MKTRRDILTDAHRVRYEIRLHFNTVRWFNENRLKPGEEPIDPDPDGFMAKAAAALDDLFAREGYDASAAPTRE